MSHMKKMKISRKMQENDALTVVLGFKMVQNLETTHDNSTYQ